MINYIEFARSVTSNVFPSKLLLLFVTGVYFIAKGIIMDKEDVFISYIPEKNINAIVLLLLLLISQVFREHGLLNYIVISLSIMGILLNVIYIIYNKKKSLRLTIYNAKVDESVKSRLEKILYSCEVDAIGKKIYIELKNSKIMKDSYNDIIILKGFGNLHNKNHILEEFNKALEEREYEGEINFGRLHVLGGILIISFAVYFMFRFYETNIF